MRNETHDPALLSWETTANLPDTDFPIQNLPFAIARREGSGDAFAGAVAIGDFALNLGALAEHQPFAGTAGDTLASCRNTTLNNFMALGHNAWSELRLALSRVLRVGAQEQALVRSCLIPLADVEYALPASIGDYTDFYTSIHHATNIGKLFRPDNPLLPNYHWVPIGYHGRSSSIGVSGQTIHRPCGQLKAPEASAPHFGPSERLDYELEVGMFIGVGNALGEPIAIDAWEEHVLGLCLLNDWSARDIQAWEYQPLGPFLGKSFATTVSPWIVTLDALAPFRAPWQRDAGQPQPLPYLSSSANSQHGAIDMQLEVLLDSATMRATGENPTTLSRSNLSDAYWSVAQLLAHHTVNGCNLRPGDLFGSGTMSGAHPGSEGALIELTNGGERPVTLPNGEQRRYLEDGDRVILRARCRAPNAVSIGFGEVTGTVLPARAPSA